MTGEIDKDFYCSAMLELGEDKRCRITERRITFLGCCRGCRCYHRKWPTPEQFKEEYGVEYPDDGAVYWFPRDRFIGNPTWVIRSYGYAKTRCANRIDIICACTPYGKPDDKWKPEVKE